MRTASGIAAIALVAVGSWAAREPAADAFAKVMARTQAKAGLITRTEVPGQLVASVVGIPAVNLPGADLPALEPVEGVPESSMVLASSEVAAAPTDTTRWVAATARTWVNVRSNAGGSGDVVGVIKPSEKAMLGNLGRGGYRQVKSPDMSGWVDPGLFVADSARTRGP